MKKTCNKILAAVLSAVMLLTFTPFAASAASARQSVGASSGTSGDCTWKLKNGVLTISGSGATVDYSYPKGNLAPWGTGVKSVIVEDGVTGVGSYAFYKCTGLTSVTLPASVTYLGNHIFNTCSSLADISLPSGITRIGECTFRKCGSLTDVTIPAGVTEIGISAFSDCTGLTALIIPDGVTYFATGAFASCSGLTDISIPDSVERIGWNAFSGTPWYNAQPDGLVYAGKVAYKYKGTMPEETSIALDSGTKGIADEAFYSCEGLTGITIPDGVTNIGSSAFYNCTGLTEAIIPDSVTSIGYSAFSGCTGLSSVIIPESVTVIGEKVFENCGSVSVYCKENSAAYDYALERNIPFSVFDLICPHCGKPALSVADEGHPSTCTEMGLTDGTHCSVCGEVLTAQEVIELAQHQYVFYPEVPATEAETGLTAGVQCSVCGEWLIPRQVIPKLAAHGDADLNGIIDIRDVTVILRTAAEFEPLTEAQLKVADVDGDGAVTVSDATLLQMYLADYDVILV